MKTLSIKEKKKRKMLLILPLIVIPFLTFIFWKLGGGTEDSKAADFENKGLNTELPGAKLVEGSPVDKMSYYNKAQQDTARLHEAMRNDPNYQSFGFNDFQGEQSHLNSSIYGNGFGKTSTAQQITERLAQFDQLYQAQPATISYGGGGRSQTSYGGGSNMEVSRLEQLMQSMHQNEPDPEMEQLSKMLENLNELQNPQLANQRLTQARSTARGKVYPVANASKAKIITSLNSNYNNTDDAFFGTEDSGTQIFQNAVQASIQEDQIIVNGTTVKFRLVNDIIVDGRTIPANNLVFGKASLQGERLNINITSIQFQNSLYQVQLTVFDLDGIDGIRIPDAISRKVAKEGIDQGLQNISLGALDPSFAAQAAGTGIEVVKSFLSRKTKLVQVKLKSGYKVLLRDDKQKNDPVDEIKF